MKVLAALFGALAIVGQASHGQELSCDLRQYEAVAGISAEVVGDALNLRWDGDNNQELQLRFEIREGTPTISDLAVKRKDASVWTQIANDLTPEFRVVSGIRRMTGQQLDPLRNLDIEITPELVAPLKWGAFWDAPLDVPGMDGRGATNLGMPRILAEIDRSTATYQADGCIVRTDGARLEVSFPGLELGIFSGYLQYTIYKGTNLLRMEAIASTQELSVAYKYDAGLEGMAIQDGARVVWRDLSNLWQNHQFGGTPTAAEVPLKASNRVVIAEGRSGSIAVFPPPHTFFWAREVETNLGYSWYRKESDSSFSFGVRHAEREEDPRWQANFALYNARPGTSQRMAVYFYVSAGPAESSFEDVLAFTRGDHYKPIPGYQVMASHFHLNMAQRLRELGSLDESLPDFEPLKAAGINIISLTEWVEGPERLEILSDFFEGARRHSDKNFLIMPNEERIELLGGHWDILFSHPVFWTLDRAPGQPFVEPHPSYGTLYHVGSADDVMEMARRENALIFMPHPRTKGSTYYPDVIQDTAHFRDETYRGIGWRWGMGLDLSEQRMSDYRVMPLFDEMSNWMADLPTPMKYVLAITETLSKSFGDDVYANNPVNYLKIDSVPTPDDMSSVIETIRRGDYFVTSGEVLIPSYSVDGTGTERTVVAEVEWTFPLEFVEVVWGDGQNTDRQIIRATHLPAFGRHRFEIPLNTIGKKWVRFAVWDSAGNGAFVQPIKLPDAMRRAAE